MPVEFRCTNCRRRLRVPRRWAGDAIDCPRCAAKIIVPQQEGVSQGGVFESRSFERSLRKLDPPQKAAEKMVERPAGAWDAASLADFDAAAVLAGEDHPETGPESGSASTRPRRRSRRALGLLACLSLAALASAAVIAAFWLFKRQ